MKKNIKKIIIKYIGRLISIKWPDNRLINVGIGCSKTFSTQNWNKLLDENFTEHKKFCNIIFLQNKLHKYLLAKNINIYFTDWLDGEYLYFAQNLKWVHFPQVGIEFLDRIDTKAIEITTSAGLCSRHVAEHALSLILMFLRRLDIAIIDQTRGRWSQKNILSSIRLIEKTTIGICGLGNNGREVAVICKKIGFRVIGFDKNDSHKENYLDEFFDEKKFEDFLKNADFIVICLPLNKETLGKFSLKEFRVMKRNAFIINVSRSSVLNEKDLKEALNKNIIAGAAIDVLSKEPPQRLWSFLQRNKNLIITPHVAGNINLITKEIQIDFINRLKKYVLGKNI